MRNSFLLVVASLLATALPIFQARAGGLVISSGREGGYYHDVALGLRAVLRNDYLTTLDVRSSQGSLENLALLDDSESSVDLALTQVDALKYYIHENPTFADEIVEIADVGKECVFLVVGRTSGITSAADLKADEPGSIAVGREGSGAAVTWEFMNRLEPAFQHTRPSSLGIIEALLQLGRSGQPIELRAALLVQRPRAAGTPIEIVLDQRERYAIVPVRAGDIGPAALDGGRAVYSFEKISVGFGSDYMQTFDTLCTRGLLIASKPKLSDAQLTHVSQAMSSARAFIAPGSD